MTAPFSPTMPGMYARDLSIIIPVKPAAIGKSRLRSGVRTPPHGTGGEPLVRAIALDTIAAVRATGVTVLVVTDDAETAGAARALGAVTVGDGAAGGLNASILHGVAHAGRGPVGAITGDLPALRPREFGEALRAFRAAARRAFVADHAGTGTTLLLAPEGVPLDPRFGAGSAAAHAASGALALDGAWPSLRLDVDTPADLRVAVALGLGPHTRRALERLDLPVRRTLDPLP